LKEPRKITFQQIGTINKESKIVVMKINYKYGDLLLLDDVFKVCKRPIK
jgi:hypothetical protein